MGGQSPRVQSPKGQREHWGEKKEEKKRVVSVLVLKKKKEKKKKGKERKWSDHSQRVSTPSFLLPASKVWGVCVLCCVCVPVGWAVGAG